MELSPESTLLDLCFKPQILAAPLFLASTKFDLEKGQLSMPKVIEYAKIM